jgi:hypothetical protein
MMGKLQVTVATCFTSCTPAIADMYSAVLLAVHPLCSVSTTHSHETIVFAGENPTLQSPSNKPASRSKGASLQGSLQALPLCCAACVPPRQHTAWHHQGDQCRGLCAPGHQHTPAAAAPARGGLGAAGAVLGRWVKHTCICTAVWGAEGRPGRSSFVGSPGGGALTPCHMCMSVCARPGATTALLACCCSAGQVLQDSIFTWNEEECELVIQAVPSRPFQIKAVTVIHPEQQTGLEGMFCVGGVYATQVRTASIPACAQRPGAHLSSCCCQHMLDTSIVVVKAHASF